MKDLQSRRLFSRSVVILLSALTIGPGLGSLRGATIWLDELDLSKTVQDWGSPRENKSVQRHPLTIAGEKFERGLGTHAESTLFITLNGGSDKFTARVGVDDEITDANKASVEFSVLGDGRALWKSGLMKAGQPARAVSVDLHGIQTLELHVGDAGDGNSYDHADWVEAKFQVSGARPATAFAPREEPVILTPKSPPQPRIRGPRILGVRPGHPVLFAIPATGQRPMRFSARNLPRGLQVDGAKGFITGQLEKPGEYNLKLRAENDLGSNERPLKIVCGRAIALTPPLGWNSWNCFAGAVDEAKVRAAADAMVSSGLINHGWTYINIDDTWEDKRDSDGRILSNKKFSGMKALADYVHAKGLKIGLYSSPGPKTCAGFEGSWKHEALDARQYAAWGFDYLKYDWCSYGEVEDKTLPPRQRLMKPYEVMREALKEAPRDILFSLCQYGMGNVWEWGARVGGNSWRTTGDITDSWPSMAGIGFRQAGHQKYAGPGHWNDPDMLVVGRLGWGRLRPSRLTPNEQYTHISLWCLLDAPLLIGCDMSQMEEFTRSLLTNDEVLEVNQDPLGRQAAPVSRQGPLEVWAKQMEDGSKAVGLFNRSERAATVTAQWSDLGLSGARHVRDLWRQKDLGQFETEFKAEVPRHGVVLVRVW